VELGIAEDVQFAGFVQNPFAYYRRADLFVMSSAWEGLPTALIEALACGCPVVSTDCPSGPAEILDKGRYGRLVPVGDHQALAEGIMEALDSPPSAALLEERANYFSLADSVDRYEKLLVMAGEPEAVPGSTQVS
jgi:glycosyltransferase involved in cell wall biosynthesis